MKFVKLLFIVVGLQCINGQRKCPIRPTVLPISDQLTKLRIEMAKSSTGRNANLEAYIITSDDEHQSEFVADHDKRLEFMSGFRGNGQGAVTKTKAAIWVEPEDVWLAEEQVDCEWAIFKLGNDQSPHITEWIRREIGTGFRVGADSKLIPASKWDEWKRELEVNHIALVETSTNLVDDIWVQDRPPYRTDDIFFIDGGESRDAKLAMLRGNLTRFECGAMIVTALDEIAWLMNVRGREGTYSPFIRSYLIVTRNETIWYLPKEKTEVIYQELAVSDLNLKILPLPQFWKDLRNLAFQSWGRVLIPGRCEFAAGASHAIASAVTASRRVVRQSPVIYLKARKNAKEIVGMQNAGRRASAAFVDFLANLEDEYHKTNNVTELSAARKLEESFNHSLYQGPAAPTKIAIGNHATQTNYYADNTTDLNLDDASTIIVKSATHYTDGTAAITRTIHFGSPSTTEVILYTNALASLIELSRRTFPQHLKTSELDVIAKSPLWEQGFTYNHSTGHGIGSFLSYKEPPININRNYWSQTQVLHKGYFITLSPSQVRYGSFGTQLENTLEVVPRVPKHSTRFMEYLAFKETTLVPFETKLIEPSLLTVEQVNYINDYHQKIRDEIGEVLKKQLKWKAFDWLIRKAKTINPVCNAASEVPLSVLALVLMFSVRFLL